MNDTISNISSQAPIELAPFGIGLLIKFINFILSTQISVTLLIKEIKKDKGKERPN